MYVAPASTIISPATGIKPVRSSFPLKVIVCSPGGKCLNRIHTPSGTPIEEPNKGVAGFPGTAVNSKPPGGESTLYCLSIYFSLLNKSSRNGHNVRLYFFQKRDSKFLDKVFGSNSGNLITNHHSYFLNFLLLFELPRNEYASFWI